MEQSAPQTLAQRLAAKKKTRSVVLPISGETVQVKQSVLYSAMMANIIPTPLLKRVIEGTIKETPPEDQVLVPAVLSRMGLLVMQFVADPVIVEGPARNPKEISIVDLEDGDIAFLVGLILRSEGAEEMGRFRNGSRGPDVGPDVPAVQSATVNGHAG